LVLANDLRTFGRYHGYMMAQISEKCKWGAKRLHPRSDRVFLLRCWQESGDLGDNEQMRWRFSLEEVSPQRWRQGFVALEDLLAFLRREFGGDRQQDSPE